MWPVLSAVLSGSGTERSENPAWVCRPARLPFVSQPMPDLLCSTMSDILDKTAKASIFSVCRYSPERKLTGGGPWLQTSVTCFKGRVSPHCFFLLQAVNTVPFFFSVFFFSYFPLFCHVVVAFFHRLCKDSVTFLLSSILHGAPIKPFLWSDLVRMLAERRAAPAGKWSESPSVSVQRAGRVAYFQQISALL